jgi:hypothetical protein
LSPASTGMPSGTPFNSPLVIQPASLVQKN